MTKFSKEFRLKLVNEVDQGVPLNFVAQKYGVGRSTLNQWYANYSHGGVKQLVSNNKRYTQEFKINAIEYRWQHDLSYKVAAAELEIPTGTLLHQWEKRDLITAQLQGNVDAMNQSIERLYQSADNFASYLASINPYINETEWKDMMATYVQDTIEQANSFITGNYSNDIELFRRLTELTNRMGESFAEGNFNYITSGGELYFRVIRHV